MSRTTVTCFRGLRIHFDYRYRFLVLLTGSRESCQFRGSQRAQRLKKFKISIRDWNFQATNLRLKISIEIENFKRATQQGPFLWGIIKVGIEIFNRDWKFQSRLKVSSLDWKFQAYGLKISRDQSGLNFFNRWALWVFLADQSSERHFPSFQTALSWVQYEPPPSHYGPLFLPFPPMGLASLGSIFWPFFWRSARSPRTKSVIASLCFLIEGILKWYPGVGDCPKRFHRTLLKVLSNP